MASLVGQQLKDTYDSLLKTSDNDALGGTYKEITDGSGNGSNLYLGTGGRVGIGTNLPSNTLSVFSSGASAITIIDVVGGSTGAGVLQLSAGTTLGSASFDLVQNSAGAFINQRDNNPMSFYVNNDEKIRIEADGDIAFYDDANNQGLFWDASAGSLGIGTNLPDSNLHIYDASGGATLKVASNTANAYDSSKIQMLGGNLSTSEILFGDTVDSDIGRIIYRHDGNSLAFDVNAGEKMRIDSSGNVGIGTTNIANNSDYSALRLGATASMWAYKPTINGNLFINENITAQDGNYIRSDFATSYRQGDGTHKWYNAPSGTAGTSVTLTPRMTIDSSGNVLVGKTTSSIASEGVELFPNDRSAFTRDSGYPILVNRLTSDGDLINFRKDGTTIGSIASVATGKIGFYGSGGTGAVIDSSGNLLVGTDTTTAGNEGMVYFNGSSLRVTRDSDEPLNLDRLTTDGSLIDFKKDGTTVGQIGAIAGLLTLGSNNNVALTFTSSSIRPSNNDGSGRDNAIDLGQSGNRFQDIYATNGTIQTSDVNEKQDIEELDDAELRVAQKAKTLLRKFRWKSSVEEKGDEARIHFGIIAQDLEQAFTDEGLDAGRYGMFIKSTWTNEEGEEQTRLGVRYNQLLAFIISSI